MQKDFLGMQYSLLLQFFFYLFCLTDVSILWRTCAYIHISDGVKIIYELPLLPNNTASVTYLHKLGVVGSVDWTLITWVPAWWWLGKNLTFDKTVYILYKHWKFLYTIISPTRSITTQTDSICLKCYIPWLKWTMRYTHRNTKDVTVLHHLQVGPEPAHSTLKQCNNTN